MDLHSQQEKAPRVLLGSAVTRLLRVRSLYYELVAVAILGFAGTGRTAVRQPVLHRQVPPRHGLAQRGLRHHRPGRLPRAPPGLRVRRPLLPPRPPAPARHRRHLHHRLRGALRPLALRAPALAVRDPAVPGQRGGVAAGHLHLPDAGRHRAARDAHHLLRHVRRLLARLRRLHRLGAARRGLRRHRGPARHRRGAHADLPGLCRGRAPAHRRLAQRAPGHHAGDRGRDRALHRGQAAPGRRGHPRPAGPQPRLLLRHQPGPLRRQPRGRGGGDGGAARDERRGQVDAAARRLGAVAPPPGGDPHLRHELDLPRARADHRPGRRAAGGREDDLPRAERARQPAHRGAHAAPGPGRARRRPTTRRSRPSPSWRPAWTSRPARSRAASSRCSPSPG